ncbi:MAG: hypothetical protein U1E52_00290 [Geminicoccaceae bacterium]
MTLRELEAGLKLAVADAAQATKDEYYWRAVEVSAKLVSVSCDLLITGLEDGAGPAGKAVSTVYDVAKLTVDAFNGDLGTAKAILYSAGGKADALSYYLESAGSSKARFVGHAKTLVNLGYDLFDYLKDGKIAAMTSPSGNIGARRTALAQLRRIQAQIARTEEALAACMKP